MKMISVFLGSLMAVSSFAADAPFIRDWLVSGPYPNYQKSDSVGAALATDFLVAHGGEERISPTEGLKGSVEFIADTAKLIAGIGSVNEWGWKETKTFDTTWRVMKFESDKIDTDKIFLPIRDYFVFYASTYFYSPIACDVTVAVGSDDENKVFLNDLCIGYSQTSQGVEPGTFNYRARVRKGLNKLLVKVVDRTGQCGFCVQLKMPDTAKPVFTLAPKSEEIAALAKALHPIRPKAVVEKENAELEKRIAELKTKRIPELERESVRLKEAKETAFADLQKGFRVAEANFDAVRAKALVGAKKSIDGALPPQESRRKLCINGFWDASVDGGKTWEKFRLPQAQMDYYFLTWHLPVRLVDKKNPWGKLEPVEGWSDFNLSKVHSSAKTRFRTTFDWNGKGTVHFISEAIRGSAAFYVNGKKLSTTYDGNIGVVRVPLENLVQGKNTLEIDYNFPRGQNHRTGLLGDLYLEYLPEVYVDNVWVKTSYTNASIRVQTDVVRAAKPNAKIEIKQYVVENGRVRVELTQPKMNSLPNYISQFCSSTKWANPKLWGPGGVYGNPDLYELVTDVYVDGVFTDRQRETFGFREFFIFHTDFFLNGKHIILQGDVGHTHFEHKRVRDIAWNIYREDGINTIRTHDGAYWCLPAVRDADRMGMMMYLQMYPAVNKRGTKRTDILAKKVPIVPFEEWTKQEEHQWNLANYKRWWMTFRNSPSVVIWSTDNELLTQAWDTPNKAFYYVRADKIGALYEKYVKSLDPSCVMTRDGDVGTHNSKATWFEDPPCDTANYHYPDFVMETTVVDWQEVFEWRPAVWGETLYCSYGAWNNWIGPIPRQVQMKADRVRKVASVYRKLGVPAQIYMGLGLDGYAQDDDTGKGNPWGITRKERDEYKKNKTLPKGFKADEFPFFRIPWPAQSGAGERVVRNRMNYLFYTCEAINWFDSKTKVVVTRNAVAKAYRESLLPQPPLRVGADAEIIVTGVAPNAAVWATRWDGEVIGVRADADGRAWFTTLEPGMYTFNSDGKSGTVTLAPRGSRARKPGFENIPELSLN